MEELVNRIATAVSTAKSVGLTYASIDVTDIDPQALAKVVTKLKPDQHNYTATVVYADDTGKFLVLKWY